MTSCSSVTSFSLYTHLNFKNKPKFPAYPTAQKPLPNLLSFPKQLQFASTPGISLATCSSSITPTTQNKKRVAVPSLFKENIATLLVSTLIFSVACLVRAKPVLAIPPIGTTNTNQKINDAAQEEDEEEKSEDEEMCVKLLRENPRDVEALKMVVNVKMKRGKTKEAVDYVERLVKLQPGEVEWRLLQALCYEMMGQLSKAKRLFKDVLKQQPLSLRALHGLAMVMHKNHEGPAVFDVLEGALEVAQREKRVNEERNIRILIAQMHVVKGELHEALQKFQILIDENPRDFRPYLCQGIVYSLLDKKTEAEEQFEIYRSLVPEEFAQRGFLDDVVLAAKTESRQQLEKEFKAEFS